MFIDAETGRWDEFEFGDGRSLRMICEITDRCVPAPVGFVQSSLPPAELQLCNRQLEDHAPLVFVTNGCERWPTKIISRDGDEEDGAIVRTWRSVSMVHTHHCEKTKQ